MDRYVIASTDERDYDKTSSINGDIVYLDKAIAAAVTDLREMGCENVKTDGNSAIEYHLSHSECEELVFGDEKFVVDMPQENCISDGGGGKNHYDLPPNATQLLDLIEHVNMNGNIKDIFKACYRLGRKAGVTVEYDNRKMVLYSIRELGRVLGRKDYINLAIEVVGHHDITRGKIEAH